MTRPRGRPGPIAGTSGGPQGLRSICPSPRLRRTRQSVRRSADSQHYCDAPVYQPIGSHYGPSSFAGCYRCRTWTGAVAASGASRDVLAVA
jgi:hypothetical protein